MSNDANHVFNIYIFGNMDNNNDLFYTIYNHNADL